MNEQRKVSETEKFYDDEIAPELKKLMEKANAKGLSFIAVVEYSPGERGRTTGIAPDAGIEMLMLNACARAGNNIDGFVLGMAKYCAENGIDTSQSIVLKPFNQSRIITPGGRKQ